MKRATLLTLLTILPGLLAAQPASRDTTDRPLLLTNARIVDPATETIRTGALLIRGGRIADVLDAAPADADGRTLDLSGQWVIPSLHDLHVHSYGNRGLDWHMQVLETTGTAKMMLYAGVTAFLDLFSPEDYIFDLRDRQRSEGFLGADIYAAGPILIAPGGHATRYGETRTVTSPANGRATVDSLAARSPDVVKLVYNPHNGRYPSMDRATMEAIIDAAHRHGLKTVVHVDTNWKGPAATIQAGADAITHTPSPPMPDSLVSAMRQQGTVWIPTLAVHTEASYWIRHPERLDDDLLQAVADSALLASYRDTSVRPTFIEEQIRHRDTRLRSVAKAAEAGVPILAGTDAGNPGLFQGYSLHRELVLLTEAGLSPWEALRAATTRAGAFLGQSVGVQPGDLAHLVVLEHSPVEDIRHTRHITRIIHHGQDVDRNALLHTTSSPTPSPPNR